VKKILLILIIGIAILVFVQQVPKFFSNDKFSSSELSNSDIAIENAFKNKQSNIQVGGSGKVINILPDDTQNSRRQKFIIQLNSGQTLLIAHNIDIAPRINILKYHKVPQLVEIIYIFVDKRLFDNLSKRYFIFRISR